MKILILYCSVWDYEPKAASLAAALRKARAGIDVEIKPGKTGQFDVLRDGQCIYSRDDTGRFPSGEEILGKL